ncbi:hypothetical protein Hdeb2414_s0004g00126711 [Helianthus debilis subsp. tardiflorus]
MHDNCLQNEDFHRSCLSCSVWIFRLSKKLILFKCRKESVTMLLRVTSAGRLGITIVISADSIWHMMRSFVDENQSPLP